MLGYSQCSYKDISVSQSQTGVVENKPQWTVTVRDKCSNCPQKNVKLDCTGFQTELVMPYTIFKVVGNECILNDGKPLDGKPLNFYYVWDTSFPLNPISSEPAC